MPGSFIWLCLFLVVPFQSSGAPVKGKRLGRTTRLIFQNINIIANSRGQSLGDLISETRQAYAKEFFGDPLESRQVEIQGLEGFNQDTTVETFVRRAHKRFSIFYKALSDILNHWPHGFETNRKLYEKISTLTERIQELRDKMKFAVDLFRNSTADSALTTTSVPQSNEVWTQSAFKQNKWILGVLGKLETNMRSTLLEIKDFLKVKNRR